YQAASGSLTFAPGETTKTFSVLVNGVTTYEADETFVVNLSGTVGATAARAQGMGTVQNDDAPPALSVDDVVVSEGDNGTTTAVFTISLSAASGLPVTVDWST